MMAKLAPTQGPPARKEPRQSSTAASPAPPQDWTDRYLNAVFKFITSMWLTVACLVFAILLVFLGTLAQVEIGLLKAQNEFFRSFLVLWGPQSLPFKIPLPGGYLVGGVLLINLVASHFKRFRFSRDKAGIWMVHFGLILLLLGQLGTDKLSRESMLHLRIGQAKNYTEDFSQNELAVIDTTDKDSDKVVAIPQGLLARQNEIRHPELPFTIEVKKFFPNSTLEQRSPKETAPPVASRDLGLQVNVHDLPRVTAMDQRDVPSAVVGVSTPQGSLGTWLVSEWLAQPQTIAWNNRSYQLVMRLRRYYKPFTIQLVEFRHDIYPGTDIPKNFSSRVRVIRPPGEDREVKIYMNNPLRYAGETYYQADWDHEDDKGTKLQVVHNPSWLTPYFSCILVGLGLVVQFATHLFGFSFKRRTA